MPPVNLTGLTGLNLVDRLRVGPSLPNSDPTLNIGDVDCDALNLRSASTDTAAGQYNATVTVATLSADISIVFPATGGTVLLEGVPATGNLDMNGNLILNIGAAGTDFTAGGGLTLATPLGPGSGGTGVANNAASTLTISGNFATTFTVTGVTGVTLPTTGTLATLAGTEELDNKTLDSSVGKGTWTASGTWTIPAVTLGGTVSGGGNQINNVIIGTSTPLAGAFTTLSSSGGLTVTASGGAVQAGNFAVNGTVTNANNAITSLYVSAAQSAGAGAGARGIYAENTLTKTGNTGNLSGLEMNVGITVNGGVTATRAAQVYLTGITATVTGTLTDHNTLYLGTPANGSTVKTIDTASGAGTPAHLTTSGTWTNASSWADGKILLGAPEDSLVRSWADWLLSDEAAAQKYRYPTVYYAKDERLPDATCKACRGEGCELCDGSGRVAMYAKGDEVKVGGHQDYEYDTIFPILDTMPDTMRVAITTDAGGGIGSKDMDGWLYTMLRHALQRIAVLEGKVLV